jgi:two-component system, OmpR family, response regulator MprA
MDNTFLNINNNKKSILFLTENLDYISSLKDQSNKNYNFSFLENEKFHLLNKKVKTFDLIIFDNVNNSLLNFINHFKVHISSDFNTPMIVLEDDISNLSTLKDINTYAIFKQNISQKYLLANIEIALNFLYENKKILFENKFYFDINKKTLFQDKKIIKLTRIEKKLIDLLVSNPNDLISYEDISKIVWKNKKFSMFTLRNTIKHIREKTYETFIQNISKKGYLINVWN